MPTRSNSLIPLLVLAWTTAAQADAFKCRSPDGGVLISTAPCGDGSKTLTIQPGERITPEQRHQAEKEVERQRKMLAERETARSAEEKREQEALQKLAEEESSRRTLCIQNAQREPDPLFRADLIAACNGVSPQRPVVVQQPVYIPAPPRRPPQQGWACVSGDCKLFESPIAPPKPSSDRNRKACRQVTGVLSCN